MIIKSMGRKASNSVTGQGSPFAKLVQYMNRSEDGEKSQAVLWNGFYGHQGMSSKEIVTIFEKNAQLLKERKNGNVLYHEILSFSRGYRLEGNELARAVADIGQEYLRLRAPHQMAYGAVHWDTDHIHLHLMISANAVGKRDRVRLSKVQFSEIQKVTEQFVLTRYGALGQTQIYDRDRPKERLKTQSHEQAMKSRTGEPSKKEALKAKLHTIFERAGSVNDLIGLLHQEGIELYTRGKSTGVLVRDGDGVERRHRLESLGVLEHYKITNAKLLQVQPKNRSETKPEKHQMPNQTKTDRAGGGVVWGVPEPTTPEIVIEEIASGKLHEAWHPKTPESRPEPRYTDDILKDLQGREERGQDIGRTTRPTREDDTER